MYNAILLIIGIILIVFSIINISKIKGEEEKRYEEIVKIYDETIEFKYYINELVDNLELLIDSTINKVNIIETKQPSSHIKESKYSSKLFTDNEQNEDDSLIKQIYELKQIGLTNREIAQKLNRGIREIDILLKVDQNINKQNKSY